MILAMPDSIHPADLPPGYPAYLGYADGNWPTAPELRQRFPGAHIIALTVTGNILDADGIDVEPGNPDAAEGAGWAARKLEQDSGSWPIIYASTEGTPGYGMHDVIAHLITLNVPLPAVRLLSAHYGAAEHICGPGTCRLISVNMDGTQWTNQFPGQAGSLIDMSAVLDSFFPDPAPPQTGAHPMRLPPAPGDWGPTAATWLDFEGNIIIAGPNGGNAIYWTKSADGGKTWSTPVRL